MVVVYSPRSPVALGADAKTRCPLPGTSSARVSRDVAVQPVASFHAGFRRRYPQGAPTSSNVDPPRSSSASRAGRYRRLHPPRRATRGLAHLASLSPARLLADDKLVGVTAKIDGGRPGPTFVLDATVDTAPFGDRARWTRGPVSGEIEDGWLYGRGAVDSKAGVGISPTSGLALLPRKTIFGAGHPSVRGGRAFGSFAGAVSFFERTMADRKIDAIMIGYPGLSASSSAVEASSDSTSGSMARPRTPAAPIPR